MSIAAAPNCEQETVKYFYTSLFNASILAFTFRAIFPTSSTSFSIRFLIAVDGIQLHWLLMLDQLETEVVS